MLRVGLNEGLADPVADGARLATEAATGATSDDVKAASHLGDFERLLHEALKDEATKVAIRGTVVDRDGAGPGHNPNTGNRVLALSGSVVANRVEHA